MLAPYMQRSGNNMKTTQRPHDLGQSLWLDSIARNLPSSGTLKYYIDGHSLTYSSDSHSNRLTGESL